MSVTVIDEPRLERPPDTRATRTRRTLSSLVPFAALSLYGVSRWGTMMKPDPTGRLLGMLALALLVALLGLVPQARRRSVAIIVTVVGILIIIPLSGLPLTWITHERVKVTVDAIGQGLSGLPNVLVPYEGINQAVRAVIVMGAGVLLLDGALMMAFAPRSLGELRPAVAALPLIVLAVVPAALARPSVPYLHGVLLFLLLAAMVWGERIRTPAGAAAAGIVVLAACGALIAAPAVDPHTAWVNFQKLAGRLGAGNGERFNWAQGYGPLSWPRKDHQVLQVVASRRAYWKAEDLETFDGRGWVASPLGDGNPLLGVSPSSVARWTQTLHVTVTGMSSDQVIAAGVAQPPTHIEGTPVQGASNGTWIPNVTLRPGDSYLVRAYTPQPSASQLADAGDHYQAAITSNYTTITLPRFQLSEGNSSVPVPSMQVSFSPFHASTSFQMPGNLGQSGTTQVVEGSPYGRAYALARRLAAGAATPYAYAIAIKHYLAQGYQYNEDPSPAGYPIESFLFVTHRGYCQQFAGAMALLLRMGGVPARVSAGFTTGTYQSAGHDYSVSDLDAHAWVEAWFPSYGWVTFDPTPGQDPALSGKIPPPSSTPDSLAGESPAHQTLVRVGQTHRHVTGAAGTRGSGHAAHGSTGDLVGWLLGALGVVLVAALALGLRWSLVRRAAATDPVAELERAFARGGRPLAPGTTLAGLEHRFREDPDTAGYIHALRMARYCDEPVTGSTHAGRRALRAQLALGRGVFGRLRALWALPPAPSRRR